MKPRVAGTQIEEKRLEVGDLPYLHVFDIFACVMMYVIALLDCVEHI